MNKCAGCDHTFRPNDLAPYQRNADGTLTEACRHCISTWIKSKVLWQRLPFWIRKEGKDVLDETYLT